MPEEYRETAPARHTRPRDTKFSVFTVLMQVFWAFSKKHANFNKIRLFKQVGPNSIGFCTFISVIHPLARGSEGPRARG